MCPNHREMLRWRQGEGSGLHPAAFVIEPGFSFCDLVSPFLHTFLVKQSHLYRSLVWFGLFFSRSLVHFVKTIHLVHKCCMRKRKSLHHTLIKDLMPFYNYEFMERQWAWNWVSSWVEYALVIINPSTSATLKLSPSFHFHPLLIPCCVPHPVIQLKFHLCAPAASLFSAPKPSQCCSCRKPVYIPTKCSACLGSSEMEDVSEETAGHHLHNAKKYLLQLCK